MSYLGYYEMRKRKIVPHSMAKILHINSNDNSCIRRFPVRKHLKFIDRAASSAFGQNFKIIFVK